MDPASTIDVAATGFWPDSAIDWSQVIIVLFGAVLLVANEIRSLLIGDVYSLLKIIAIGIWKLRESWPLKITNFDKIYYASDSQGRGVASLEADLKFEFRSPNPIIAQRIQSELKPAGKGVCACNANVWERVRDKLSWKPSDKHLWIDMGRDHDPQNVYDKTHVAHLWRELNEDEIKSNDLTDRKIRFKAISGGREVVSGWFDIDKAPGDRIFRQPDNENSEIAALRAIRAADSAEAAKKRAHDAAKSAECAAHKASAEANSSACSGS